MLTVVATVLAQKEMLDLMKSDCTSLGGVGFGDAMSEQWNRRQRAGDIEGLKQLDTCCNGICYICCWE